MDTDLGFCTFQKVNKVLKSECQKIGCKENRVRREYDVKGVDCIKGEFCVQCRIVDSSRNEQCLSNHPSTNWSAV